MTNNQDSKSSDDIINKELDKYQKLQQMFFDLVEKGLPIKSARFYQNRTSYFRGN
jgi:hypothetical protein